VTQIKNADNFAAELSNAPRERRDKMVNL